MASPTAAAAHSPPTRSNSSSTVGSRSPPHPPRRRHTPGTPAGYPRQPFPTATSNSRNSSSSGRSSPADEPATMIRDDHGDSESEAGGVQTTTAAIATSTTGEIERVSTPPPSTQPAVTTTPEPPLTLSAPDTPPPPPPPPPPPAPVPAKDDGGGVDGLLTPLPGHDWNAFLGSFQQGLREVADEEAALFDEYHKWTWFYELWSRCRSSGDELRMSQEMATVAQWTRLKEEVLERARAEHTESMLAISRVLGIDPKSVTPTTR